MRKFRLDVFLSDGALSDDCVPPRDEPDEQKVSKSAKTGTTGTLASVVAGSAAADAASRDLVWLMASSGIMPILSLLYVPDYIAPKSRIAFVTALAKRLEQAFPCFHVSLTVCEGPLENMEGVRSHFDGNSMSFKKPEKRVAQTRIDFEVAIAQLSRSVCYHTPKLIIGHGKGALVAFGYARPYVLERSMQTRNVQRREVQAIGEAWGKVQAIVGLNPRMYKRGLMLDIFRPAMPDFLMKNCPVPTVRQFVVRDYKSTAYDEEIAFAEESELEMIDGASR